VVPEEAAAAVEEAVEEAVEVEALRQLLPVPVQEEEEVLQPARVPVLRGFGL
jgi:hypothetical protein